MSCLIISVISFVLGSLGAGYFFRRHQHKNELRFIQQEKEIQERKEALERIMYRTHHHGINPIAKRIRGACSVMRLINNQEGQQERLFWLNQIEQCAFTMETDVLNTVKEFEHLQ